MLGPHGFTIPVFFLLPTAPTEEDTRNALRLYVEHRQPTGRVPTHDAALAIWNAVWAAKPVLLHSGPDDLPLGDFKLPSPFSHPNLATRPSEILEESITIVDVPNTREIIAIAMAKGRALSVHDRELMRIHAKLPQVINREVWDFPLRTYHASEGLSASGHPVSEIGVVLDPCDPAPLLRSLLSRVSLRRHLDPSTLDEAKRRFETSFRNRRARPEHIPSRVFDSYRTAPGSMSEIEVWRRLPHLRVDDFAPIVQSTREEQVALGLVVDINDVDLDALKEISLLRVMRIDELFVTIDP